jgi:glycosyltransferase involved in cell wall biosynthesis
MGNNKTVAVIPAFNEEETIYNVVKSALNYVDHTIVVDDNSFDCTKFEAMEAGAEVYKLTENRGAGYATRKGLELAGNADIIITLDGDGQHNPEEIPLLIDAINDGYDFVIGSRFLLKNKIPSYRKLGINIITLAYNLGHKPITDAQCCFRAFNGKKLVFILPVEKSFGFSVEMLVKARLYKLKIKEVPVSCKYRGLEHDSSLNPIIHGVSVLIKTLNWRWRLLN